MSLEVIVGDVARQLRAGRYPNEQAVSQGIVLRVLGELGWDIWNPAAVWPEFKTSEGRVDFALCHPPEKPAIFVEVKQPGKAEESVRQALLYAFHAGVPFVVLTDGLTWSFYLPTEQGTYEERRVYKLDLYERSPEEAAAALRRYLDRKQVESGKALEMAKGEYRSRNRQAQARQAIPLAWRELVDRGDEQLVELVTGAVESKSGVRPDANDVAEFLAGLGMPVVTKPKAGGQHLPTPTYAPKPGSVPAVKPEPESGGAVGDSLRAGTLTIRGKRLPYANAMDATVLVLRHLATDDKDFLSRLAQHPNAQGRKRRYIARTPEELYPDREDLSSMRADLPGGWLVATNLNNKMKLAILEGAAEVAGLTWETDLQVNF